MSVQVLALVGVLRAAALIGLFTSINALPVSTANDRRIDVDVEEDIGDTKEMSRMMIDEGEEQYPSNSDKAKVGDLAAVEADLPSDIKTTIDVDIPAESSASSSSHHSSHSPGSLHR